MSQEKIRSIGSGLVFGLAAVAEGCFAWFGISLVRDHIREKRIARKAEIIKKHEEEKRLKNTINDMQAEIEYLTRKTEDFDKQLKKASKTPTKAAE